MFNEDDYPNAITEYVLDGITMYEQLNVTDPATSQVTFKNILSELLEQEEAGELLGHGAQLLVQTLKINEDLVIKRLRKDGSKNMRYLGGVDQYWELLKQQHALVAKYFGRFVPETEFLEVNTNFNNPYPLIRDASGQTIFPVQGGFERVMLQKRIHGIELNKHTLYVGNIFISNVLKSEVIEFINRYRNLMLSERIVIEDQIAVAVDNDIETIKITDTNHFRDLELYISENKFLKSRGVVFSKEFDTNELVELLAVTIPQIKWIKDIKYEELLFLTEETNNPKSKWGNILNAVNSYAELDMDLRYDIKSVFTIVQNFPPHGQINNRFILKLINGFQITAES